MRTRSNYWIRQLNSSRLSRRRFIGTATSIGAGAAGLALVGCGDDDDDAPRPTATPTSAPANGDQPTPTADDEPEPGGPTPGGVAHFSSANNTWDTMDWDRSRFTTIAAIVGPAYENIVHYRSYADALLEGAFAESWETPDDLTITFTLREGSRWHNKPPVDGRLTQVEDMVHFVERNKAGVTRDGTHDANFYRSASYQIVESVEAVDAQTMRVTFSQVNPFFLALLAGSYAKVQAPEAVDAFEDRYADLPVEATIGTGPFVMTVFDPEGTFRLVRNTDFRTPSWWDGIDGVPLFTDQAAQQAAFEQKQLDTFAPASNAVLADLLSRYDGQIYNTPTLVANPMAGTYYGGTPPWSDQRLIGAIFRAVDRHAYLAQIVEGRGALSANIPPSQAAFGITERELITFPGYRPPAEREDDIREAREMWAAAEGNALGEIIVDVPDLYEGVYSGFSGFITNMLNTVLQTDQFTAVIEPYATISTKVSAGDSGAPAYGNGRNNIWWGWISDVQSLEPTDSLWRAYNSKQEQFKQFGVVIPRVDELTEAAVVELDIEARKEYCRDIVRELLRHHGAGIPFTLLQFTNTLRWNYYHVGESPAFINVHNLYRDHWFDLNDPTWQGRPA